MTLMFPPTARLRPYVASLWLGERPVASGREQVLPTGTLHIAVRLEGGDVQLYDDPAAASPSQSGDALVAGARMATYWKDASVATRTIGAQLRPGAARALFGVSAAAFSGRHVSLDDAWERGGAWWRDALHAARGPRAQLEAFEAALLARLRPPKAMHPAVARALADIDAAPAAARLPAVDGISERHFIAQFREATGLSPKRYARVRRFQSLLQALGAGPGRSLAELAADAGYSDQSHCHREFLAFSGTTPQAWRQGRRPG